MKKILYVALFTLTSIIAKANNKFETKQKDTTVIVDKNIRYKIYDDENFIYLTVSSSDKKIAMSMLKNGLTVYFDTKGKTKKKVYIKYPDKSNSKTKQQKDNTNSREKLNINSIIQNIPEEAEYEYYGKKRQFNKDLNMLNISLGYELNGDILEYYLKMPKGKVTKKNKNDLSKLTIGVITNKRENNNNAEMNADSGGRSRGGRSGGGRRGGGRRGGGTRQGSRDGNSRRETIEKIEIDFWFDANLKTL